MATSIDYNDYHIDLDLADYSTIVTLLTGRDSYKACMQMPTADYLSDVFEVTVTDIRMDSLFKTADLVICPALPEYTTLMSSTFNNATSLAYPPVIPSAVTNMSDCFGFASSLNNLPSIPASAVNLTNAFRYTTCSCSMVIRPDSLSQYTGAFAQVQGDIILYGDQAVCQTLAATATGTGTVTWADWFSPVTAVTNRGEGSRTTYTDINRMVRNGVLAVSSYCPARMSYTSTDIVHQDEWLALVAAAQTIDANVTTSTHYANLNRIEAAFDSAL